MSLVVVIMVLAFPTLAGAAKRPATLYYLSLGDSWAQGFQPGFPDGSETLHGFANRVVADLAPKHPLTLENFGCGGVTSWQMINAIDCPLGNRALNGIAYPVTSQLNAALDFIRAHRGSVALVSISIGGNDVSWNLPLDAMQANIRTISKRLRGVLGPHVPIIGLGTNDTDLANWLVDSSGQASAAASVATYQHVFNPAIQVAYTPSKVAFADIGAAFGTYVPLTSLTNLPPYGAIPYAVARICALTWSCSINNGHPNGAGYEVIARSIVQTYLKIVH